MGRWLGIVQRCSGVMVGLRKAGKLRLGVEWRKERKGKEEKEEKASKNSITFISFYTLPFGQKPI